MYNTKNWFNTWIFSYFCPFIFREVTCSGAHLLTVMDVLLKVWRWLYMTVCTVGCSVHTAEVPILGETVSTASSDQATGLTWTAGNNKVRSKYTLDLTQRNGVCLRRISSVNIFNVNKKLDWIEFFFTYNNISRYQIYRAEK